MSGSDGQGFGPYLSRIVWAVGSRIIPPGGDIPYSLEDTHSIEFLYNYITDLPRSGAIGIKALLIIFDLCPFVFIFKPGRFVNLTAADQDRHIRKWQDSRIYWLRMAVLLMKTIFGMGYYNDPKVLEHMGWYYPCSEDRKR